jgi:hypothetical protein
MVPKPALSVPWGVFFFGTVVADVGLPVAPLARSNVMGVPAVVAMSGWSFATGGKPFVTVMLAVAVLDLP